MYNAPDIVARMQSWVASNSASIVVQSSRLHLDPTCDTMLDTLKAADCLVKPGGSASPQTTQSSSPSVKPAAISGHVNIVQISGITVGVVVIALLAILIVLLIVVVLKKTKLKRFVICWHHMILVHNHIRIYSLTCIHSSDWPQGIYTI